MKDNYIPRRDGDLNSFEENFLAKLNFYAPTLGISAQKDSCLQQAGGDDSKDFVICSWCDSEGSN